MSIKVTRSSVGSSDLTRDEIFLRVLQRRGLERTQENINKIASLIHDWEADPKHPELGYKPSIPLPFYVRHWIFWERPGCYPCRKKFKNTQEYNEHYLDNHMGENKS